MKKAKLYLDYKCFPTWVYEDEQLMYNDIPKELKEDKNLDEKLVLLQEKYDSLFVDTDTNFEYIGFESDKEKGIFLEEFDQIASYMQEKIGKYYKIDNEINL